MIKTRLELKEWINEENRVNYSWKDSRGKLKSVITHDHTYVITRYLRYLRHEEYHRNNSGIYNRLSELFWARKKNILGNKIGLTIPANVFEKGLVIYHIGSIVVNGEARVGKNCQLHGNNCIGNNGKDCKAPIIGDNCDIGIGAKIIGDVCIGDDNVIGANSVVNKSYKLNNIVLAGVPAKIVKQRNRKISHENNY